VRGTAFVVLLVVAVACDGNRQAATGVIADVVDGDTVVIVVGGRDERVRLIGIDTPEVHVEEGPPECFGREASAFTAELLPPGTAVRLERDVVGRDDYGRLLAYVYISGAPGPADDVMVNEAIVRHGFARVLTIAPNGVFHERLVAAARAAERDGLGLWTACAG
jgi:micrococcal nuclease